MTVPKVEEEDSRPPKKLKRSRKTYLKRSFTTLSQHHLKTSKILLLINDLRTRNTLENKILEASAKGDIERLKKKLNGITYISQVRGKIPLQSLEVSRILSCQPS